MSTATSIDDVCQELKILSSRVDELERKLGQNGTPITAPFDFALIADKVYEITQELFPGTCKFTNEVDPEHPEDRYVVVNVEATGDIKDIMDRKETWHNRVRQMWPDVWDNLTLFVVPR
jgi:hypothetical protein